MAFAHQQTHYTEKALSVYHKPREFRMNDEWKHTVPKKTLAVTVNPEPKDFVNFAHPSIIWTVSVKTRTYLFLLFLPGWREVSRMCNRRDKWWKVRLIRLWSERFFRGSSSCMKTKKDWHKSTLKNKTKQKNLEGPRTFLYSSELKTKPTFPFTVQPNEGCIYYWIFWY